MDASTSPHLCASLALPRSRVGPDVCFGFPFEATTISLNSVPGMQYRNPNQQSKYIEINIEIRLGLDLQRSLRRSFVKYVFDENPPPLTLLYSMSRLFERKSTASNSVNAAEHEEKHLLCHPWTFWFCHRSPGQKGSISDYADHTKQVASFATVHSHTKTQVFRLMNFGRCTSI
jgi:hypothetical protein